MNIHDSSVRLGGISIQPITKWHTWSRLMNIHKPAHLLSVLLQTADLFGAIGGIFSVYVVDTLVTSGWWDGDRSWIIIETSSACLI